MSIKLMQEDFPEHRRHDPLRGAEARTFGALQNLGLDGHGLYEFRYRREGKQVDFPLWLHGTDRFAVQVKGGQYEMDAAGQWRLRTHDGNSTAVQSPLQETEDGCIEMRNGIHEATGYRNFVAGVLIFPDMQPNEDIERVGRERHHVYLVWGLDSLAQDLRRIAGTVVFKRPPKSIIAENEWRELYQLQFRGTGQVPDSKGVAQKPANAQDPANAGEGEHQFTLGSATFHIQHVDTLVLNVSPRGSDPDGKPDALPW